MVKENIQYTKQKYIFNYINKFSSSFKNKYCLFCRTEITEQSHCCNQMENVGDKLVKKYFELDDEFRKNIVQELNEPNIKFEESISNIRNKILAYSL